MTTKFERLLPLILEHEGVSATNPTGYVNDPNDPGGETKWGISQRAWGYKRNLPQFNNFPPAVRDLDREQMTDVYTTYWHTVFDKLPLGPALVCFDAEVNAGNGIKMLQSALKIYADGIWNIASEQALRLALRDVPGLVEELLWKRVEYYVTISKPSPVNQNYLAKLWLPRLVKCRMEAEKFGAN